MLAWALRYGRAGPQSNRRLYMMHFYNQSTSHLWGIVDCLNMALPKMVGDGVGGTLLAFQGWASDASLGPWVVRPERLRSRMLVPVPLLASFDSCQNI